MECTEFSAILELAQNENLDMRRFPPFIQCICSTIWPEKYEKSKVRVQRFSEKKILHDQLPFGKDLLLLCSGGLGSVASLWKILANGRDVSILFYENVFKDVDPFNVESNRQNCIEKIAFEARSSSGEPLANSDSFESWITTAQVPKNISSLCRKARIAILIVKTYEVLRSMGDNKPYVIWGSVGDCRDLFQEMNTIWPLDHVILFDNIEQAIFCLSEARIKSIAMKNYEREQRVYSLGCRLFEDIFDTVCSCWTDSCDPIMISSLPKPFPSMCGDCSGCERYINGFKNLMTIYPGISLSSVPTNDLRHWKNLKITEHPRRKFSKNTDEPWIKLDKNLKQRGRPKKKKEEEMNSDSDWEEVEEESESESEFLAEMEDDEGQEDQQQSEEEFVFDDDEEPKPKRRKRKSKN